MNLGVYLEKGGPIQFSRSSLMLVSPWSEHQVLCPRALPQVADQADGGLRGQGPVLVTVLRPQAVLPGQQEDPELPPLITAHLPLQTPGHVHDELSINDQ